VDVSTQYVVHVGVMPVEGGFAMRPCVLFIILFLCIGRSDAQVIADYVAPPDTAEELFAKAAVVVRGRVEAGRLDPSNQRPRSLYSLRVLEVLKSGDVVSTGSVIDIQRIGGTGEDKRTSDPNFPAFQVHDELVLFLERGPGGFYTPLFGPEGSFKLVDGRAHAFGNAGALSKRHNGNAAEAFLAEIRTLRN
jgi:hypothetical protein